MIVILALLLSGYPLELTWAQNQCIQAPASGHSEEFQFRHSLEHDAMANNLHPITAESVIFSQLLVSEGNEFDLAFPVVKDQYIDDVQALISAKRAF